jgi:hypothetical protein
LFVCDAPIAAAVQELREDYLVSLDEVVDLSSS